jgi:hypothetical protein
VTFIESKPLPADEQLASDTELWEMTLATCTDKLTIAILTAVNSGKVFTSRESDIIEYSLHSFY